jgi:hypothetical protein
MNSQTLQMSVLFLIIGLLALYLLVPTQYTANNSTDDTQILMTNSGEKISTNSRKTTSLKDQIDADIDKIRFSFQKKEGFVGNYDPEIIKNANEDLVLVFEMQKVSPLIAKMVDSVTISKIKYGNIPSEKYIERNLEENAYILFSNNPENQDPLPTLLKEGTVKHEVKKSRILPNKEDVIFGEDVEFSMGFVFNNSKIETGPFKFIFNFEETALPAQKTQESTSGQLRWLSGNLEDTIKAANVGLPIFVGLERKLAPVKLLLFYRRGEDGEDDAYAVKAEGAQDFVKYNYNPNLPEALVKAETDSLSPEKSVYRTKKIIDKNGNEIQEQLAIINGQLKMIPDYDANLGLYMVSTNKTRLQNPDEIKGYFHHEIKYNKKASYYNRNGATDEMVNNIYNQLASTQPNNSDNTHNFKDDVENLLSTCDLYSKDTETNPTDFKYQLADTSLSCFDLHSFPKEHFKAYEVTLDKDGLTKVPADLQNDFFRRYKYFEVPDYNLNAQNDTGMTCGNENMSLDDLALETPENYGDINSVKTAQECREICNASENCVGFTFQHDFEGNVGTTCKFHQELDQSENNNTSCYQKIFKYKIFIVQNGRKGYTMKGAALSVDEWINNFNAGVGTSPWYQKNYLPMTNDSFLSDDNNVKIFEKNDDNFSLLGGQLHGVKNYIKEYGVAGKEFVVLQKERVFEQSQ